MDGLSIHHMGTRKGDFFKLWHETAKRLFLSHVGQEAQELDKKAFKAFKKSHKAEIQAEYEKGKEKRLRDYMQMYNTVTICKRCHFNLHHGKVLCRFCGEGYHKREYSCCWACLPVQEPERWRRILEKGRREQGAAPNIECFQDESGKEKDGNGDLQHLSHKSCEIQRSIKNEGVERVPSSPMAQNTDFDDEDESDVTSVNGRVPSPPKNGGGGDESDVTSVSGKVPSPPDKRVSGEDGSDVTSVNGRVPSPQMAFPSDTSSEDESDVTSVNEEVPSPERVNPSISNGDGSDVTSDTPHHAPIKPCRFSAPHHTAAVMAQPLRHPQMGEGVSGAGGGGVSGSVLDLPFRVPGFQSGWWCLNDISSFQGTFDCGLLKSKSSKIENESNGVLCKQIPYLHLLGFREIVHVLNQQIFYFFDKTSCLLNLVKHHFELIKSGESFVEIFANGEFWQRFFSLLFFVPPIRADCLQTTVSNIRWQVYQPIMLETQRGEVRKQLPELARKSSQVIRIKVQNCEVDELADLRRQGHQTTVTEFQVREAFKLSNFRRQCGQWITGKVQLGQARKMEEFRRQFYQLIFLQIERGEVLKFLDFGRDTLEPQTRKVKFCRICSLRFLNLSFGFFILFLIRSFLLTHANNLTSFKLIKFTSPTTHHQPAAVGGGWRVPSPQMAFPSEVDGEDGSDVTSVSVNPQPAAVGGGWGRGGRERYSPLSCRSISSSRLRVASVTKPETLLYPTSGCSLMSFMIRSLRASGRAGLKYLFGIYSDAQVSLNKPYSEHVEKRFKYNHIFRTYRETTRSPSNEPDLPPRNHTQQLFAAPVKTCSLHWNSGSWGRRPFHVTEVRP